MKQRLLRQARFPALLGAAAAAVAMLAIPAQGVFAQEVSLDQAKAGRTQNAAPLFVDKISTDRADRIYVAETNFDHLTDSRVNVFDGNTMRFLGTVPAAFNHLMMPSPDGSQIYVATTYYTRVTRGDRTDVVEIWDADTLKFIREIEIPPKRASMLNYDGALRTTNDGRFLLVQNANPAISTAVVDLQKNEWVNEITSTGACWLSIPLPGTPRSFGTVCGDGSLMSLTLGDDGKVSSQKRSAQMFSVKDDPVFISPAIMADSLVFVSFYGNVYEAKLNRKDMSFSFERTWSLLQDAKDKAEKWVPGGFNMLVGNPKSGLFYVFMHPDGEEGSHKNPAAEIWVFDLAKKQRVARIEGRDALSMSVSLAKTPQLLTIDGGNVNIYDISKPVPEYLRTIEGAANAALQVYGVEARSAGK